MSQFQSNKWIRGLDLNSNPYSYVVGKDPYGGTRNACTIADECVLTRQRMIGNRKGFDYFTASTSANVDWLYEYQTYIIQHQVDNTLWYGDPTSGTRTQYTGTYVPPASYRTQGTVSRGNLFFTTTAGLMKLDKYNGTPIRSGICKGLDTRVTTGVGTGGGFMSGYSKCAYRITWVRTDANNQKVRGDVSTSVVATNSNRQTLTSLTSAAGVATATTPAAHGFATGNTILIAGATQTQYNGSYVITSTGATTFTYAVAGGPVSPATGTITAERYNNTSVAFTVPWDVLTGDTYEVWRTVTVDAGYSDPGDTMYLVVATVNVAAAGSTVTINDTTNDITLQASQALYTNATQDGALQGNSRPPTCAAIASYKDYFIMGNCSLDHQYNLAMLSTINFVAGTSKITLTRTDGNGARSYTFNTTENVATQTAQIYTGGISPGLNVELTTRSLVHVINGDSGGWWYAEYTSGPNANPGQFRIFARSPLTGAFAITASDTTTGQQFTPVLPVSGTSILSSSDTRANRLFYAKFQQPDAVPILNTIDVGRLDQPILRIVAVRDACYIIKTDGVWYLSGLSAPFSLVELDSTCHCVAASTVATMNNQIFMLSNQGVVQVSTSGITVISVDIEPAIMQVAIPMSNISNVAFGVGHESSRQYYLWLPSLTTDAYATHCYVYHNFIQEWTHWTRPAMAGIALNSNYTLYISSGREKAILKQRSNGDLTDYSDETLPITVVSKTGPTTVTVTWTSTLFQPVVGMSLHQTTSFSKVVAVQQGTGSNYTLTIDRNTGYTAGAATVRMPINSHIRLSPNTLQEGGLVKTVYAVSYLPEANTVSAAQIEIATNESQNLYTFPINRALAAGWGVLGWGDTPWGDVVSSVKVVPFSIDSPIPDITGEFLVTGWIHSVSQEQWVMAQCAIIYDQFAEIEFVA